MKKMSPHEELFSEQHISTSCHEKKPLVRKNCFVARLHVGRQKRQKKDFFFLVIGLILKQDFFTPSQTLIIIYSY